MKKILLAAVGTLGLAAVAAAALMQIGVLDFSADPLIARSSID
jgi:hypothetical protein